MVAWIALCQVPLVATSVPVRVVIISLMMSTYMFLGAYEFWRGRDERLASRWLAIAAMATYGLALLSRIPMVAFIDLPAAPVLFQGTSWFGVVSVVSLLFIAAMACSILAMSKERMELGYRREAQTDSLDPVVHAPSVLPRERGALASAESARQEGSAIILLDLDSFKQINDQFGHLIGDAVLQVFADVTRSELRPADVVGRIGGEEFAVFLPHALGAGCHVGR